MLRRFGEWLGAEGTRTLFFAILVLFQQASGFSLSFGVLIGQQQWIRFNFTFNFVKCGCVFSHGDDGKREKSSESCGLVGLTIDRQKNKFELNVLLLF
jgi:hypothetical protein